MAEDLGDTIRENAAGPKRVSGDAGSVEQHSPSELIEADKHAINKEALAKKNFGMTKVKIISPGTV